MLQIHNKMDIYVLLLFALCGFRVIRFGRGLRINGPADKNITAGMTMPIECHSDQYGIVFEFTHRSSTQSVGIAECDFNKDLGSAVFMRDSLKSAYNITRISRTCILTILSLMEDQCGTYSCKELYVKSEYVYFNMSCIGTIDVTRLPGVTKVPPDTGRTGTIIGISLGVAGFIAFIVALCLVYRKRRNTTNIPESGASTHEHETLMFQETGQEQSNSASVISQNIDVECTEQIMIDESTNNSTVAFGDDSVERLRDAKDYSKPLNNGTNLDIPDANTNNSICLNNLCTGPNVSPVKNDSFTGIENVPESCMNTESTDSKIEEQKQGSQMDQRQRLNEELKDVANSGAFKRARDIFKRKQFGEELLEGQKLKSSTFV
ncbi:uncharacterized protein LOC127870288 isoform X4 [Dreissena polymorpha]|uniref:uncharacterized protein LOC127870288 isoform X4 n=1 Tax=Dreissena polymorpha TaxID=45954 RepID=UPI002263DCFC|nr:uncharacterized protein LOC127870288 isoform X4 [Dreissena polymorpha]